MFHITCGVIKLSDEARDILAWVYTIISLIQTLFSSILIINSLYISFYVAPNLHSEKAIIRLIFTVIAMLATQLALYYLSGIFICRKCHTEAYKKNSRYLLRIWTISGYSSILNVVIIGSMSAGVSNHIVRSMHHSMVRGMKRYLKDINWKRIIDSLQYRLQCCGSKKYTDWHQVSWISTWHLISSQNDVSQICRINGDHIYLHAVPWSCCRTDYDKQCFHDPLQQFQFTDSWNKLQEESVYNVGCIEILRQPIEDSFLCFIVLTYFILLFQIILTIISRYLYTSYRNAVILGDPFGVSPGWIVSRKTASEIMAESRASLSSSESMRSKSLLSRNRSKSQTSSNRSSVEDNNRYL